MRVYNKSAGRLEDAEKVTCPRCKGHGGVAFKDDGTVCSLCGGEGIVWRSGSGWTRKIGAPTDASELW